LPSFIHRQRTGFAAIVQRDDADRAMVTEEKLIGQPTVLIVTPSKAAAEETRQWVQALRKNINQQKIMVRDILAIDLPFFMSEKDALGRAREKIPKQYHDQTYLLAESGLEQAFNIPRSSEDAFVLVLNAEGKETARVKGEPTRQRINEIESAVASITS
jgi:bifunctional pyridoxal-dependent enzyme with beta-cystathionase and maltose regulon repressor activities